MVCLREAAFVPQGRADAIDKVFALARCDKAAPIAITAVPNTGGMAGVAAIDEGARAVVEKGYGGA